MALPMPTITNNIILSQAIRQLVITAVLKYLDNALEMNAQAADSAGLETKVTRTYDGVGLSNDRACEWCISRECTDLPYAEAKAQGVFERHPGCGCVITYDSALTGKRTINRGQGWAEA